jgi:hypothetical protein
MAPMKREEIEEILQRDMPGYRLVRRGLAPRGGLDARPLLAQGGTPDLDTLKRKYLRDKYRAVDATISETGEAESEASDASNSPDTLGDEDEIVAVEPETAPHPWDRASRPKVVVISGKEKRIVGHQG